MYSTANVVTSQTAITVTANDNSQSQIIEIATTGKTPQPDLEQAQRFLALLDPKAEQFTFQTFDDSNEKRRRLVSQSNGSLAAEKSNLVDLNRGGAGIFVTVQETDLTGRKTENVRRVRAIIADFDDGVPNDLPLAPSIKVQSSPMKYQYYWLCEGTHPVNTAGTDIRNQAAIA